MRKIGILLAIIFLPFLGAIYWISQKKENPDESKNFSQSSYEKHIQDLVKTHFSDSSQLIVIYAQSPELFYNNEKAALQLADAFILTRNVKEYRTLRKQWEAREKNPQKWFILDADYLLLKGKKADSLHFLKSKTFEGGEELERLKRLTFLTIQENPKQAWGYLELAQAKDPENSEIKFFQAKILEKMGEQNLALSYYRAAANLEPQNYYLQDQLAQFYLRHKEYPEALKIWEKSLSPPSLDIIWLQSLFWSKVIAPLKFKWNITPVPKSQFSPLIEYLIDLKPGVFWDSTSYEKIPNQENYLRTEQLTFWLRLLQAFKGGNENEAWNLLNSNPFTLVSWESDLELALKRILSYRHTGTLKLNRDEFLNLQNESSSLPEFFMQLEKFANKDEDDLPNDLRLLLLSPNAFSIAFLSANWMGAALGIKELELIPHHYPDWVTLRYTEAIRQVDGNREALEFAMQQKSFPLLSLLIGELLIKEGRQEEALSLLNSLVKEEGKIGAQASWLLSLIYLERKDYVQARKMIEANSNLANDVSGKEAIARIAILEGNTLLAHYLYKSIQNESLEAKSYFAQKAFEGKNYEKAQALTEELMKSYPEHPTLKENLLKILDEKNKE